MANKKNVWSPEQEEQLFIYQSQVGNKWAYIALKFGDKDQNSIKNKFYSTLRKGFRKINKYITDIKRKADPIKCKSFKVIHESFISKLIAVVDNNYDEKYEVKLPAIENASNIQQKLITIARSEEEYVKLSKSDYNFQENLLNSIAEFSKSCKKRKGKKKEPNQRCKSEDNDNESLEQSLILPFKEEIKIEEKTEKTHPMINEQEDTRKQGQHKLEEFKVEHSTFLKGLENKQSVSTIVEMNNFANMASQFFKYTDNSTGEDGLLIQSSSFMTHSGCLKDQERGWLYESTESKKSMPKKLSYFTEPSPYPYDSESPQTFANIMKSKNMTESNMFDDKISCGDEMNNSSVYLKEGQGSFLSQVPLVKQKTGEFLIQSADLKLQIIQESNQLSNSLNMENQTQRTRNSLFPHIDETHFKISKATNFANEYAFTSSNAINDQPSLM